MLTQQYHIMSSDEDQPIVEDLYAGYDSAFNLVICINHMDYEKPDYNSSISVVIKKEEAYKLAKRLRISMTDLPRTIGENFEDYGMIINATCSDVKSCFSEIIQCLVYDKCRYRLVRSYGREGYCCG